MSGFIVWKYTNNSEEEVGRFASKENAIQESTYLNKISGKGVLFTENFEVPSDQVYNVVNHNINNDYVAYIIEEEM